jgi:hypothetical protein
MSWLEPYAERPKKMQEQIKKKGNIIKSMIGFAKPKTKLEKEVTYNDYYGFTIYHPMHFSQPELAYWVEKTKYERAPILSREESEIEHIASRHVNVEQANWRDLLVACALAYANEAITVVYPRGSYIIPGNIRYQARKKNIAILEAHTDLFSENELKSISRCYMAPAIATHPQTQYPSYVEEIIGESQNHEQNKIPAEWRLFGQY